MIQNDKDIELKDIIKNIRLNQNLYKRLFIIGIILVTIFRFITIPTYKSETIILPKASSGLGELNYNNPLLSSGLSSLGKQKSPVLSLRSYPMIILGNSFLDQLLNEVFISEKYGEKKLEEILSRYNRIKLNGSQKSKNKLTKLLSKKLITVNTNQLSSSVKIDVTMNEKQLSTEVLDRVILLLNNFQNNLLQKEAKNKSEYLLESSQLKKNELYKSENDLRIFLDENKGVLSPSQDLQLKILNREVSISQQIYMGTITQLEKSKIEEIENLDIIFLISEPTKPHKKSNIPLYGLIILYTFSLIIFMMIKAIMSIRFSKNN